MQRLLIGLTGKAGVGKDTVAEIMLAHHGVQPYAFAGPIKGALSGMGFSRAEYDKDGAKDAIIPDLGVSYRHLAQTLGTEWGRHIHPDFWLILAKRFVERWPNDHIVISDVRFENEAKWIRELGGHVIHVRGPVRRPIAEGRGGHVSEAGIEALPGDLFLHNLASIDFLREQISTLMEALRANRG